MRGFVISLLGAAMLTSFLPEVVSATEQISVDRTLNWSDTLRQFTQDENALNDAGKTYFSLQFSGASYQFKNNAVLPVFGESFKINAAGTVSVRIENAVYETVQRGKLNFDDLTTDIQFNQTIGYISKKPVLDISFIPLRKNRLTGNIERLVSFRLIAEINTANFKMEEEEEMDYSEHSILASGTWYKISVIKDGIFKIDKSFLESLGINLSSVNVNQIGIFGNGGGMLPELNSAFRFDDLQENAVERVGLEDGSFDEGDYILFYGQAPNRWQFSITTNTFKHQNDLYSNKTYYFISTDKGTGKSITDQNESLLPVTKTSSTYDALAFIDQDKINLINSGRVWYGDAFDAYTSSKDYAFSFPNIDPSSSIIFRTDVAGASASGNMYLNFDANTTDLGTITLTPVEADFTETFAKAGSIETSFFSSSPNITIHLGYSGSTSGTSWLNYIELLARSFTTYNNSSLFFRDHLTIGDGQITNYIVTAPGDIKVWDITDQTNVKNQKYTYNASDISFKLPSDSLKEFVAFYLSDVFPSTDITSEGSVANQDIHNIDLSPDYVIVTHPAFLAEARRLATFHHDLQGFDTLVVTTNQVYNEFSSGSNDISAIRDMMRMFYVRAGIDAELEPRYLLLFGDCSFDYKNTSFAEEENTLRVPNYESNQSLALGSSYGTDDYFGFLDESEGLNLESSTPKLDIGVGRIPVVETTEATEMVDKIIHYKSTETFGSWRNLICFLADDEDYNTHVKDAEELADSVKSRYPVYNIDKIYFDSYQQVPGAGGERYPDVEVALNNRIYSGAFIMNYLGHGNEQNWAQERVLSVDDINSWDNYDKLPLFITATCSFSRYDNPDVRSAGELTLLNPTGGAIALVSTNRVVYASANYDLNSNFLEHIFEPVDGKLPALGDALKNGKNGVTSEGTNNRKFILLGDPALVLDYPVFNIQTTNISNDTLKALDKVTVWGEVTDADGIKLSTFNGTVYPTVFDKPVIINNLVNDPTFSGVGFGPSQPFSFDLQKNALYKGKASVVNGEFNFTFIVPKDITYSYGKGKLSYYADNSFEDAVGYDLSVVIGGTNDTAAADTEGPELDVYMNDESFVFGGLTDENPFLLVKLNDFSGINTVGNGIGHDVTATLDDDQQSLLKLNDYYEADLDKYQSGSVTYPLNDIATGRHSVVVKAWDVYNNSGEGYTEFVVAESAKLALSHVLNYPNPFTTNTSFWFEHNRAGDLLDVKVEIFSVSGRLVKTLQQQVSTEGYRVDNIEWDGLDEFGDPIGRGVYVYKLTVKAESDNSKANEFQKLVIIR